MRGRRVCLALLATALLPALPAPAQLVPPLRGATVYGHIVDSRGNLLVEGWSVRVTNLSATARGRTFRTALIAIDPSTGTFHADNLELCAHSIVGIGPDGFSTGTESVELVAGEQREVQLDYSGPELAQCAVLVFVSDTLPERSRVLVRSSDGVFTEFQRVPRRGLEWYAELRGAPPWRLHFADARFHPIEPRALRPGLRVELELAGNSALVLEVVDATTGARLADYTVEEVSLNELRAGGARKLALSDRAAGGERFAGLLAGERALTVSAAGYSPGRMRRVRLAARETRRLRVELTPSAKE